MRVCGETLTKENTTFARQKIGFLFQDSDDQLFMPTVAEDVGFGPLNMGLDASEVNRRAKDALGRVGLEGLEDRAPHHLSAGQKRRIALAGLLTMEPEVILLDEPATFLDPPARRGLVGLLEGLPQAKLIVTHDLLLAEALANRAVFFEQGRIAGEGSVADLATQFDWR